MTVIRVTLHIYDLSQGMARTLSPQILGKRIDGIWHTGVVYGQLEYYFGGGICCDPVGTTPYGSPIKRMDMGRTSKTQQELMTFLSSINHRFTMQTYHLLNNNCNNFSDIVLTFLTSQRVPQHILNLPREAISSPLGPLIEPVINQMQASITTASQGHQITTPTQHQNPQPSSSSKPSNPYPILTSALTPLPTVPAPPTLTPIQDKLRTFAPKFNDYDNIPALITLLAKLPREQSFPVLDLLRIQALTTSTNAREISVALSSTLINSYILQPDAHTPARLMALRACINVSGSDQSACENLRKCKETHEAVVRCLDDDGVKVRLTAPLLIVNLAKGGLEPLGEEEGVGLVWAVAERLSKVGGGSNEAWGLLLALGALILEGGDDLKEVVKAVEVDVGKFIKDATESRVRKVAKEIKQCLSS